MKTIRITVEGGDTITTGINGTLEEIASYYSQGPLQFGDTEENPKDDLRAVVRLEHYQGGYWYPFTLKGVKP